MKLLCICFPSFDIMSIINVLAAVGTCVSAIIAYFTLKKFTEQNKNAHKPELFLAPDNKAIIDVVITNYNNPMEENMFIEFWRNSNSENSEIGMVYSIENVGLGTAKHLDIEWEFSMEEAISEISKTLKHPLNIELSDTYLSINKDESKEDSFMFISLHNHPKDKHDFILPRRDEVCNKRPWIPVDYMKLYVVYFLAKHNLFQKESFGSIIYEEFDDFPKISVKLNYEDIGGEKYSKKFEVVITLTIFNHNDELDLNVVPNLMLTSFIKFNQIEL